MFRFVVPFIATTLVLLDLQLWSSWAITNDGHGSSAVAADLILKLVNTKC